MACPFFDPATAFSWEAWPNPPRMVLGDPYSGTCTAASSQVPETLVKTCCNSGYARGTCVSFPGGDAPDAVRFGIVRRDQGVATIRYVIERDHLPFDHGMLEIAEAASQATDSSVLERQARAFLASYLRRRS